MSSCPNIKKRSRDEYISVKSLLKQLENPIPFKEKPKPLKPELDVEEIRSKMKAKWRDPGYCNLQFQPIPVLKAKMLTEWQYERIYQAERSYKFPKNYKGIRFDSQSREFREPTKNLLPKKFNKYLDGVKQKYEDGLFGPDPSIEQRRSRIKRMLTENQVRSNYATMVHKNTTTKNGFFGYATRRVKTIQVQ